MAKTLRIHADTLTTPRRQEVEEKAAQTSVKLDFPLVFIILPSLFVAVLGPAAIFIVEGFQKNCLLGREPIWDRKLLFELSAACCHR